MRLLLAVSLGTSLVFLGQEVAPAQTGNPGQVEQKAAAEKPSITLPAGTKVMLAMTTPVWSKTVKSGDSLYCTTNFPVTIDNQMAIPPGTYAQGTIDSVTKPTRKTNNADFQVHFTKLIFANGYTVELPADSPAATATIHVQVNYQSDILLDNGSQFEMTLQNPLTLDSANVAVAVRRSKAPPIGPYQSATRCRPIPGTPGTSDTVIPGTPGTPGFVCPGPPIVTSGPGVPFYDHEGFVTFAKKVQVGEKKLKAGAYKIAWAGSGPTVPVKITQKDKEVASVMALVVVLPEKATQD